MKFCHIPVNRSHVLGIDDGCVNRRRRQELFRRLLCCFFPEFDKVGIGDKDSLFLLFQHFLQTLVGNIYLLFRVGGGAGCFLGRHRFLNLSRRRRTECQGK